MQAAQQRAGVCFLKHDVRTAHDDVSDVARFYRVRATPTFAFLVGGAKVGFDPMSPHQRRQQPLSKKKRKKDEQIRESS